MAWAMSRAATLASMCDRHITLGAMMDVDPLFKC